MRKLDIGNSVKKGNSRRLQQDESKTKSVICGSGRDIFQGWLTSHSSPIVSIVRIPSLSRNSINEFFMFFQKIKLTFQPITFRVNFCKIKNREANCLVDVASYIY